MCIYTLLAPFTCAPMPHHQENRLTPSFQQLSKLGLHEVHLIIRCVHFIFETVEHAEEVEIGCVRASKYNQVCNVIQVRAGCKVGVSRDANQSLVYGTI